VLDIRSIEDLSIIKPLWEALNRYYMIHSRHFTKEYSNQSFDDFIKSYNDRDYRLEVLFQDDGPYGYIIGYVEEGKGIIDSLYIYDDLRGMGFGEYIIKRMMTWFCDKDIHDISLKIQAGNEDKILYFQKLGYFTSEYTMRFGKKCDDK